MYAIRSYYAVNFLGIAVTGQNDLLLGVQQGIESMEKFFLWAFLPGEELDIVDEQRVDIAIEALSYNFV